MVAEVSAQKWPEHVSEWTVEMLDTLPEGNLRYELLDGTLLVSPSPVTKHQIAIGELYVLLRAACPADRPSSGSEKHCQYCSVGIVVQVDAGLADHAHDISAMIGLHPGRPMVESKVGNPG